MENSTKITLEDEEKVVSKSQSDTNSASTLNGVVEISPYRRYIRFDDINGQNGILGTTFRAFDTINAIEVNWHIICFSDLVLAEGERVTKSANILKRIQNKYIVEYLTCWIASESNRFNIITSHLPSLKDFLGKRGMTLRWKVVKKWCTRILRGLEYLHNSSPKIVHRNLTCSHIYINSSTGDIYIGDTWLAEILTDSNEMINRLIVPESKYSQLSSMPAYLAPELFDKSPLTTLVDIYSFGMCVLEIITREEPYKECTTTTTTDLGTGSGAVSGVVGSMPSPMTVGRIAYRAKHGILPRAMSLVPHPAARDFILECFKDSTHRPSAGELLQHPFLSSPEYEIEEIIIKGYDQESLSQFPDNMDEAAVAAEVEAALLFESKLSFRNSRSSGSSDSDSGGDSSSSNSNNSSNQGDESSPGIVDENEQQPTDMFDIDTVVTMDPGGYGGRSSSLRDRLDLISFDKGEDIRHDKGVQDGRIIQESEDNMDVVVVLPVVVPQAPTLFSPTRRKGSPTAQAKRSTEKLTGTPRSRSRASSRSDSNLSSHGNNSTTLSSLGLGGMPRGSLSSINLSDNTTTSCHSNNNVTNDRVEVKLQIPKGHSKDGQFKEVEFTFNVLRDRYEVVASEMIDELELTVSIEELAKKIEDQVRQKEKVVGDACEFPISNDSNRATTTITTASTATKEVVAEDDGRVTKGSTTSCDVMTADSVKDGAVVVFPVPIDVTAVPVDVAVEEYVVHRVSPSSSYHDRSPTSKITRTSSLHGPLHFPLMSSDLSPEGILTSSSTSTTLLSDILEEVVGKGEVEVIAITRGDGGRQVKVDVLGNHETSFTNDIKINPLSDLDRNFSDELISSPVNKHKALMEVTSVGVITEDTNDLNQVTQVNNLNKNEGEPGGGLSQLLGTTPGNTELMMKKQTSKETLRELSVESLAHTSLTTSPSVLTSWGNMTTPPLASAIAITAMEVSDDDISNNTNIHTNTTTLLNSTTLSNKISNDYISLPTTSTTLATTTPVTTIPPDVMPSYTNSVSYDVDHHHHLNVMNINSDLVSTRKNSDNINVGSIWEDMSTASSPSLTASTMTTMTLPDPLPTPFGLNGITESKEYIMASTTNNTTIGSQNFITLTSGVVPVPAGGNTAPVVIDERSTPLITTTSLNSVSIVGQFPVAVDPAAAVEKEAVIESDSCHSQPQNINLSRANTPTVTTALEPYLSLPTSMSAEENHTMSSISTSYSAFSSGSDIVEIVTTPSINQEISNSSTSSTSHENSGIAVTTTTHPMGGVMSAVTGTERERDKDKDRDNAIDTDMNADDEEAEEAAELQVRREKERIEKDSRAARRAFEQRIQKHKIIQEACDEDIFKNENDYINKVNELRKKEDGTYRKREEELTKIYEDFEIKKMKYLDRKKEELLLRRRRRVSIESNENEIVINQSNSSNNSSSNSISNTSNHNNNNSKNSQQPILPQKSYLAAAIGSQNNTTIFHSSPSNGMSLTLSHSQSPSLSGGMSHSTVSSSSPSTVSGGPGSSLVHPPHLSHSTPTTNATTAPHLTSTNYWSSLSGLGGTPSSQSLQIPPQAQAQAQAQVMSAWNLSNINNNNNNNNNNGTLAGGGSLSSSSSSSLNSNNNITTTTSQLNISNDTSTTSNTNNNNNNFSSSFGGIHNTSHSSSSQFLLPLPLSSPSLSTNS